MEEKTILVMLDVRGTLDGMNDNQARHFIQLLTCIKNTFGGEKIKLFFSSHDMGVSGIRNYYQILKNHLTDEIEVDISYYLNGEYDCLHDGVKEYYFGYNMKKVDKLESKLDENVLWFGLFDDSVNPDYVKKYKEIRPMAVFRPSSSSSCEDDNMMCYSTKVKGFDGVIEVLEKYVIMLEKLGNQDLLEVQKTALFRLDESYENATLVKEKLTQKINA